MDIVTKIFERWIYLYFLCLVLPERTVCLVHGISDAAQEPKFELIPHATWREHITSEIGRPIRIRLRIVCTQCTVYNVYSVSVSVCAKCIVCAKCTVCSVQCTKIN